MSFESVLTCAIMARDVYDTVSFPGWRPAVAPVKAPDGGFYGEALTNGRDGVIVVIRGTADGTDAIDDMSMIPHISASHAEHAIQKLIIEYCKGYPRHYASKGGTYVVSLVKAIFEIKNNTSMASWANKIPEDQTKFALVLAQRAYAYCQQNRQKLLCFTGHSLGGALAQFLSEQTGPGGTAKIPVPVPCIAFNSPCMGTISGMRKGFGGRILSVNARLDPLSLATNLAGNATHSGEKDYVLVETLAAPAPPQISDPPGMLEKKDFAKWIGVAAKCYHSMDNLTMALMKQHPGKLLVSSLHR